MIARELYHTLAGEEDLQDFSLSKYVRLPGGAAAAQICSRRAMESSLSSASAMAVSLLSLVTFVASEVTSAFIVPLDLLQGDRSFTSTHRQAFQQAGAKRSLHRPYYGGSSRCPFVRLYARRTGLGDGDDSAPEGEAESKLTADDYLLLSSLNDRIYELGLEAYAAEHSGRSQDSDPEAALVSSSSSSSSSSTIPEAAEMGDLVSSSYFPSSSRRTYYDRFWQSRNLDGVTASDFSDLRASSDARDSFRMNLVARGMLMWLMVLNQYHEKRKAQDPSYVPPHEALEAREREIADTRQADISFLREAELKHGRTALVLLFGYLFHMATHTLPMGANVFSLFASKWLPMPGAVGRFLQLFLIPAYVELASMSAVGKRLSDWLNKKAWGDLEKHMTTLRSASEALSNMRVSELIHGRSAMVVVSLLVLWQATHSPEFVAAIQSATVATADPTSAC
ncbi:unnamed protein product [Vitrella brassicaformis CCMP3155]|uniref:Uncharacterized protein n=2 Tax=Vitrella brassicaformis TaxID=1169539 RepID=A0A0G4FK52_VITBC|nr:unnamed protein product [Vitrella brassicaformis CCMP3155]|eukprot:CEM13762.1 unnamed protein product [Vitrella brassicaformis CCMP3155]